MKTKRKAVALPVLAAFAMLAGATAQNPAYAAEADEFLRQFEGKWKGGGSVQRTLDAKPIRIRCALEMKLDEAGKKLENSGRCATTSGKRKVSGAISFTDSDNVLSGAFLKAYGTTKVLQSSGSFDAEAMTLNATHQDTNTDKVSRSRTIISIPDGDSFETAIYEYDRSRQAFIRIGELIFER